jgi:vacuolar-type H+-ATPase subunit D/Vma8
MAQKIDIDSLEKTLYDLTENLEKLEDRVNEIEYGLKQHINTLNDIAHSV